MMILSHRGYWLTQDEKNSQIAFKRSFDLNFGTETDVRDYSGRLVISHDMPSGNEIAFSEFLSIFAKKPLPLAINIKADGLVLPLKRAVMEAGIKDWFVFDMSIPDMRTYLQAGISVFTRLSEVEKEPIWLEESAGVWLDAFWGNWYDENLLNFLLKREKRVCVVSSELHGRDPGALWKILLPFCKEDNVLLCTDFPERAQEFFQDSK